jgi:hypothetical protein
MPRRLSLFDLLIAEGIALWMIGSTLREVDGDHDLLRAAGYLKVALVGVEKMPGP